MFHNVIKTFQAQPLSLAVLEIILHFAIKVKNISINCNNCKKGEAMIAKWIEKLEDVAAEIAQFLF
ncbi:MAG: hypothetical protein KU37_10210 [Sulfuricurvum sp. PC08-66]|nr:MAG: hypothetical protein KU37_10210 [Sulfuricurvum sp. PC08-66]